MMPSKPYILALDQGTTGSTALILNAQGQILGRGYRSIRCHFPHAGWVEQSPEDLFASIVGASIEAMHTSDVKVEDIAALGIANQRETTLLWHRHTLEPVAPAIVWQCKRTTDTCKQWIAGGLSESVRRKTGLIIDPYFSATKIHWLLEHVPVARELLKKDLLCFGTVDSWLIAKLTPDKNHLTDYTNASRTLCFDITRRTWDAELLDAFGCAASIFPKVQSSSSYFGETRRAIFGKSIPILAAVGDQQASLFGHGCTTPGQTKCTFGTGAFALAIQDSFSENSEGLLTTLACDEGGQPTFALEGSIFIAGAVIQWLRDQLGIIQSAEETEAIASSQSDNEGVYFVPVFSGLGTPHWNPDTRACILGMTRGTGKAHIVRAALESIAYQCHDLVKAFETSLGRPLTSLSIDGGVSSNGFFSRFLADILGLELKVSRVQDLTAYGAGKLCSLHPSIKKNFDFSPLDSELLASQMSPSEKTRLTNRWKKAVECVIHFSSE